MTDELRLSHIARVRVLGQERREKAITLLRSQYSVEDSDDTFLWDAEISNDLLDSHFTRMSESTLTNYAADAAAGVAFLRGHNWHELPVGYSYDAEMGVERNQKRVFASFYTVQGIPDTDDLIRRMKGGLLRDVSVGFHGGSMRCDLCGQDFWDCLHYPGIKYEEKNGDTVTTQLATFTIEDARLSEVSGVYDGSTPEAMILKAQRASALGLLVPSEAAVLENTYRIRLASKSTFIPLTQERTMEEKDIKLIRDALGVSTDDAILTRAQDIVTKLKDAEARVKELEPLASDGESYRNDLVTDALAEGVRAQGNEFDAELYRGTLTIAPIVVVKRMRDDWKKLADKQFQGGRSTVEGDGNPAPVSTNHVPDAAYS